jgi:tRNA splicing endonuclease
VYKELSLTHKVESGLIYGMDFMLYEIKKEDDNHDHEHSKILVHLQDVDQPKKWNEIYRLVRLAQEVKKQLMIYLYKNT